MPLNLGAVTFCTECLSVFNDTQCLQFHDLNLSYSQELKYIYRVSQEECARLRDGVPYGKVYRYNPKHLCPKLNGYGDNGQRKVWSTCSSTHCTYQLTSLSMSILECGVALRHCLPVMCHVQVLRNLRSITTCLRLVL
jgi:hypothetical protein